jgi:ABC-type Mn2+/Zn2+ transport system ATPase subunit
MPTSPGFPSAVAVIEAQSLSVGYGGEVVVGGVDFALGKGQTLALVGPNGSGKSTLLKTIAALLEPVSGAIRVLGGRPGAFPARVAYLGQFHPPTFTLPLRSVDVVRMARFATLGLMGRATKEDERLVEEAMEMMGVAELRDEPLNLLSGGQRQRVMIAQALARGADLLLLDEPAANLDGVARQTYRKIVRDAAAACRSVVIATHDIEEASECDYAMLLQHRVVAFGRGAEVLTAEALLSTFGMVARPGEGGVLVIERGHGCQDQDGTGRHGPDSESPPERHW